MLMSGKNLLVGIMHTVKKIDNTDDILNTLDYYKNKGTLLIDLEFTEDSKITTELTTEIIETDTYYFLDNIIITDGAVKLVKTMKDKKAYEITGFSFIINYEYTKYIFVLQGENPDEDLFTIITNNIDLYNTIKNKYSDFLIIKEE